VSAGSRQVPAALPAVAIVGRPNVGKSTLFNALTRTRDALVADFPGVTRDRIHGRADLAGRSAILVDTGGLDDAEGELESGAQRQTRQAIDEADVVLFLTDARDGLIPRDHELAAWLRTLDKPLVHVVNKSDGLDPDEVIAESSALGLSATCVIAASHRRGLDRLAQLCVESLPPETTVQAGSDEAIHLALIGRPNAGKSTLLNRLAGEERALATATPGTTRDPVHARIERDGQLFEVVDTAGIRRRRGSHEGLERFSTIKALQAMEQAQVVVLLLDSIDGITEQDARLAGHVIEAGRALVIVLNKWDCLDEGARKRRLRDMGERMGFVDFAPVVAVSALHGSGLGELTDAILHVFDAAGQELSTPALTRALRAAVERHAPPGARRAAPKLRYAHAGGVFPTRVIIHGNRTAEVTESYRRYLVNRFRRQFNFTGVPLRLVFRDSENPYAGRRNKLTPRQIAKRKRLQRFSRQKKNRR
jgi:GTP-binding protein